MFRFKCEKCGYKRARLKLCGKCGRTNPCPVKKMMLQIGAPVIALLIFAGAIWSAQLIAQYRASQAAAGVTSFAAPREPKAPGGGGGGRRGGALTWR